MVSTARVSKCHGLGIELARDTFTTLTRPLVLNDVESTFAERARL